MSIAIRQQTGRAQLTLTYRWPQTYRPSHSPTITLTKRILIPQIIIFWEKDTHTHTHKQDKQAHSMQQRCSRIDASCYMTRCCANRYIARCAAFGSALFSSPPLQESKLRFLSFVSQFPQNVCIIFNLPIFSLSLSLSGSLSELFPQGVSALPPLRGLIMNLADFHAEINLQLRSCIVSS